MMKNTEQKQLARFRRVMRKHFVKVETSRDENNRLKLEPWYVTSDGLMFGLQSTTLESIYDFELAAKRISEHLEEQVEFNVQT